MAESKPLNDGNDWSRMSGDAHVRFWESVGVRFPRATHLPLAPFDSLHSLMAGQSASTYWLRSGDLTEKGSREFNVLSTYSASKGFLMPASAPAGSFFVYIHPSADGGLYAGHT